MLSGAERRERERERERERREREMKKRQRGDNAAHWCIFLRTCAEQIPTAARPLPPVPLLFVSMFDGPLIFSPTPSPLSVCLSVCLSACLCVSLSACFVSMSACFVSMSACLPLYLPLSPSLPLSLSPALPLSRSPSLPLSPSPALPLPLSLPLSSPLSPSPHCFHFLMRTEIRSPERARRGAVRAVRA